MATLILIRHGRTHANAGGVLAGRQAGVDLDEVGRSQVAVAAERLAGVDLERIVTSPMDRCRATAQSVMDAQGTQIPLVIAGEVNECDYGAWQGRSLRDLMTDPLWPVVQRRPSTVTFPGGVSMQAMRDRMVGYVREQDALVESERGRGAVWAVVSHGDLIKAALADALGMPFDHFQRLQVSPASISIVSYDEHRPVVVAMNTSAGDVGSMLPAAGAGSTETVGGGNGPVDAVAE